LRWKGFDRRFEIGRSLIALANMVTHRVRIYLDHLFGDWPMSGGRPGDDTPNDCWVAQVRKPSLDATLPAVDPS
jgi:hypothetical protein